MSMVALTSTLTLPSPMWILSQFNVVRDPELVCFLLPQSLFSVVEEALPPCSSVEDSLSAYLKSWELDEAITLANKTLKECSAANQPFSNTLLEMVRDLILTTLDENECAKLHASQELRNLIIRYSDICEQIEGIRENDFIGLLRVIFPSSLEDFIYPVEPQEEPAKSVSQPPKGRRFRKNRRR